MPALAEDLVQLLFDDETGRSVVSQYYLDAAIGGAVLLELVSAGRVSISAPDASGRRTALVRDASPTGDEILDDALVRLAAAPLALQKAIESLVKGARVAVLNRLVERGLLRHDVSRVLGIFRLTSWPAADAAHEAQVRADIVAALQEDIEADPHTASLIALLHAVKALPKVVPGDKAHLREAAERVIAQRADDESIRAAVKQVYTAIDAYAAAVTTAAAAAG
jgi:hypothetical protein